MITTTKTQLTKSQKRAISHKVLSTDYVQKEMDELGHVHILQIPKNGPYEYWFSVTRRGQCYDEGSRRKNGL